MHHATCIKNSYRKGILPSKILTGKEFGPQKILPERNMAIKNSYRKRIWLSKNLTRKEFGSKMSLLSILPKLNTLNISLVLPIMHWVSAIAHCLIPTCSHFLQLSCVHSLYSVNVTQQIRSPENLRGTNELHKLGPFTIRFLYGLHPNMKMTP